MNKTVMAKAFKRIVSENGLMLEHVPDEFIDDEMLVYAVFDNQNALKFVPENKRAAILIKIKDEFRAGHIIWSEFLENIPKDLLSTEICRQLIENETRFFPGVPEEYIDEEMCYYVVQNRGDFLKYIPEKFKTQELCNKAVETSGVYAIEDVPEDNRTPELYTIMVKQNTKHYANIETTDTSWLRERIMEPLSIIPKEMQSSKMYEIIAEIYPYPEIFLRIVPENLITQKICMELAKRDGRVLKNIPKEMKTRDLCIETIKNGGDIEEVPEEFRNADMYIDWLSNRYVQMKNDSHYRGDIQQYIKELPTEIKNDDFWKKLVEKNGFFLKYVPENIKNEELYMKAIQSFPNCIVFIPKSDINTDILIEAIRNDVGLKYIKKYIETELATPEVYLELYKKEKIYRIDEIPKEKRNFDIYVYAAQNSRIEYNDIPVEITSNRKFWEEVIERNASFIKYAPQDMITPELCQNAIDNSLWNIKNIPVNFITLDMCKAVMAYRDGQKYLLEYIPEEYITDIIPMIYTDNFFGVKLEKLLECIPEEKRTDIFYIKLLNYEDEGIKHIPEALLQSQEFWNSAVENGFYKFNKVPEEFKTKELCKKAVNENALNFEYVPENMIDREIYEALIEARLKHLHISQTRDVLRDIPEQYITPEIYAKSIWGGSNVDQKAIDIMLSMYNFDRIHHFVPSVSVLKKYPVSQIEKFDKRIWWYLAKKELYNLNTDTKNALIEAMLTFGAFDKDANQGERVGLIEHFATYLPKCRFKIDLDRLSEEEKEIIHSNFEIKKYNKYVVNMERLLEDENLVNLFKSKEEAKSELEAVISEELSEYSMKIFLEEYSQDTNRDELMRYILKTGYDKQVDERHVGITLKTDLQNLKSKNPNEGYQLEKKIREIYYKANPSFMMTPSKLHRIFDGMDMEYKPEFYEFFKNNIREILKNDKRQREMSKIQNQWNDIIQAYLGQRITFEKCERYIYGKTYKNVEFPEISKLSSICGYSQEQFEQAQEIYREQLKRKESSIPQVEGRCKNSEYTYKVLRLDDPAAIFIGELTDCCQAINNAGESCMIHSATSSNGRVLIVQDKTGKVLSQSWIWRNKNVICFDNIEAVKRDSNNKKVVSREVLEAVKEAARALIEEDKIRMKQYETEKIREIEQERESISTEEYEKRIADLKRAIKGQMLNKITVGIGNTDIDLSGLQLDDENRYPEENVYYIDDSREQLIIYKDSSVEHEDSGEDIKTITSLYSDDENTKKIIDIDTSEIEHLSTYNDEYELDDEENEENEENIGNGNLLDLYSEDGYIDLGEIRTTINHSQNRAKARQALKNIREYLRTREGNEI